ncbi:helix-turn-helix domain-containing protein [Sphingobacterium suaedae]|uniref:Helix-turn-helix domain-containing protein n=1 Tax=Sphingobacterium suaedae TaxID=1686402 RepID=A0ABW5KHB0_9SPHI
MRTHTYPLETKAAAIELLQAGNTLATVSQHFGCSVATVSRWYMEYLGYRGREGFAITLQSGRWDIIDIDDI